MKWLYKTWWKWLCVVLLFYVLTGSFFVNLGSGITRITPFSFTTDSLYHFTISTYHSHFTSSKAGMVQLWFKNDTNYFCPVSYKVIDDNKIEANFLLSSQQQELIKYSTFDIIINDDFDGTFALREGLTLIKSPTVDSTSIAKAMNCTVEVTYNKPQFLCFPYREILYETIRNTFFHVPMWFVMTMLVFTAFICSILFLFSKNETMDLISRESITVALLFGVCGYLTGLVWAKYTWYIGVSWNDVLRKLLLEDVKMAAALVAMFFYAAYFLVRNLYEEAEAKKMAAAVYSIFAFVVFILCVFVLPRITDSMHPGNGGNPAFSKYDLDSTLRMFFYPAVIGWILLGYWILSIRLRIQLISQKQKV